MVSLVKNLGNHDVAPNNRKLCGGTLIAPEWVLTAAHCVIDNGSIILPESFNVIVGAYDLSDRRDYQGKEMKVSKIIIHPNAYVASSRMPWADNDIALLRLKTPIVNAQVVEIMDPSEFKKLQYQAAASSIEQGPLLTVMGWGGTSANAATSSAQLMSTQVPLLASRDCQSYRGNIGNAFCAGYYYNHKNACMGDSGGPIFANINGFKQVGVVSWGPSDCVWPGMYPVYADLSKLRSFIERYVDLSSFTAKPTISEKPVANPNIDSNNINDAEWYIDPLPF